MTAQDVIERALQGGLSADAASDDLAETIVAELEGAGYALVNAAEHQQQLASVADWQRSALTVIQAANRFLLDLVTGDGDPTVLAAAMVESGFDQRFPEAYAEAGYALVKLPEPTARWAEGPEWLQGGRLGDRSGWVAWTARRARVMLQRIEPGELTPAQARELGAALLAAAAHAEQVTDD